MSEHDSDTSGQGPEGSIFLPKIVVDIIGSIESRPHLDKTVFAHWLARGAFAGLSHPQRVEVESCLEELRQKFDSVGEVQAI